MTDPATPTTASEADAAQLPPPRVRFRRERVAVAVVFFALTGGVIVNGAVEIHKDTFRRAAVGSTFPTCSDGISALYQEFTAQFASTTAEGAQLVPRRPLEDPAVRAQLAQLDEQLLALREVCAREGSSAMSAYDSLTLWRHQSQDLAAVAERMLTPDAERALRYRSPRASPTP